MKRFLRWLSLGLSSLILLAAVAWVWGDREKNVRVERFVKNDRLVTVKGDWAGTPVDTDGRFVNYQYPYQSKFTDFLRWKLNKNPFAEEKQADTERLAVSDPSEFLASDRNGILWLGHASFFIRIDGVSILTDPVFGTPPFVKRFVEVPPPTESIRTVDYVLLSHDHRDHTDEASLRAITARFPQAKFLAGLGMDDILRSWSTPTNEIQTAGWFQRFDLPPSVPQITFVPVRHWSRRGLFDTNRRLWGGFVIKGTQTTIFFGGDSGYGSQYSEVAKLFDKIDYLIIGIGAYEPRWFMEPNHNSPSDALKALDDTGAANLIPMHFGTFDLSDEPPGAPLRSLRSEAGQRGLLEKIKVLNINESVLLP